MHSFAQFSPPAQITVVTDDNYPPYLFRDSEGRLQGILADKWELWSRKTGIPARLQGMEWAKAQRHIQTGGADVIEAMSHTDERARLYEYSPAWATLEARVFFHRSIGGINDVASLRGFTVGTKDGSACTGWLRQRGIEAVRPYPDSDSLVRAAGTGEIRLFCLDTPIAQYFLVKHGLAGDFRQTAPLYTGHAYWAVPKGRGELRDFIQSGFKRISAEELQEIDSRWLGNPLKLPIQARYYYFAAAALAALLAAAALLIVWNRTLHRTVAERTHDLRERVKELAVLHAVARLFHEERSIDRGLLDELVRLLPPGWQFPELCVARIDYGGIEARTPGWRETAWRQSARFGTEDGRAGLIEVAYLEERPAAKEGPFLAEERKLIDSLAELIGGHFERIRIQTALRDSEKRLMLSVQSSKIGLFDWNIAGNQVYFSPEWKGLLGYGDDEILPRLDEWESRLHPDDKAQVLARLQGYLEGPGLEYENEFRLRHKDGAYRWIYARGEAQRDASGKAQRIVGCHLDVTERKHAEEAMRLHAERLRALSQRLMEVEEIERRNINRELHDSIAQNLSTLQVNLATLRIELAANAPQSAYSRIDDAQSLLEATSLRVRDVMAELRPAALDDFGLLAALRDHAAACSARLGIVISVKGNEPRPRLPLATEVALFRIVQEALNNVAKHARARKVEVRLAAGPRTISLSVVDDGVGFDAARPPRRAAHYGIATMRERAEAVGASLRVQAAPGKGTRVEVELSRSPAAATAA